MATKPGRESSKDLTTVTKLEIIERPAPPEILTPDQTIVWLETVNPLPPEWFPSETLAMLEMYCSHVAAARVFETMTNELLNKDVYDIEALKTVRGLYTQETRAATSYAGKLRLTLQSTYDKSKKKPSSVKRPWQS